MSATTENFGLFIVDGNDIVDPLTYDNPNYVKIDSQMYDNQNNGVPLAIYEKNATNHAITRTVKTANLFWFTASAEFNTGDSFSVDKQSVTAVYPDGTDLESGCFNAGSNIVCVLNKNILTLLLPKISGSVEYAATAGKLKAPVSIGSASFDGSQSITLAQMGALSTTGAAASAKKLTAPVNIGSASFDGSKSITLAQMGALSENAGIYSTTEINTGKLWQSTDGNFYPIYRKVFKGINV